VVKTFGLRLLILKGLAKSESPNCERSASEQIGQGFLNGFVVVIELFAGDCNPI
jgi:hypothetical protein